MKKNKKNPVVILKVKYMRFEDEKRRDLVERNPSYGDQIVGGGMGKNAFGIQGWCGTPLGCIDCNGFQFQNWQISYPRKALKETESKVWEMDIQFKGFEKGPISNMDKALWLLSKVLSPFFKNNDMFYRNIYWFVSLHATCYGQHMHVLFWEKEQTRWKCRHSRKHWHKGKLKEETLEKLRQDILLLSIPLVERPAMAESFRQTETSPNPTI